MSALLSPLVQRPRALTRTKHNKMNRSWSPEGLLLCAQTTPPLKVDHHIRAAKDLPIIHSSMKGMFTDDWAESGNTTTCPKYPQFCWIFQDDETSRGPEIIQGLLIWTSENQTTYSSILNFAEYLRLFCTSRGPEIIQGLLIWTSENETTYSSILNFTEYLRPFVAAPRTI